MINPQWLELPMSRRNFHGPEDVRAIEVRLYVGISPKVKKHKIIVRLSLLTMTNLNHIREMLLFVCSKMAA